VAVASAFIFNIFKAEDLGIESSCCRQKWPLGAPMCGKRCWGFPKKGGLYHHPRGAGVSTSAAVKAASETLA